MQPFQLTDARRCPSQNTQHYHGAWNFNKRFGVKADSLPQANVDIDPVCYVANISGRLSLGYEAGLGDSLQACPGSRGGYNFTEDAIKDASDAELKTMCAACYQAVCTSRGSHNPRWCGHRNDGGVDIGNSNVVADGLQQVHRMKTICKIFWTE